MCNREYILLLIIIAVAAVLLGVKLGSKSLWWDEIYSVEMAYQKLSSLPERAARHDFHPPLYYLALHLWILLCGDSELSIRLLSVAASLISLPLAYKLLKFLGGARAALVAIYWMATSPFLILYSRMARYYSLAMLLGIASCLLFLKLLEGQTVKLWLGYIVISTSLIYVTYPAVALILAQDLWLLLRRKKLRPSLVRRWLGGQMVICILYLPWLAQLIGQVRELTSRGKPAGLKEVATHLLRAFYPFYAFSLGETVYPWSYLATPGLLFIAGVVILGVVRAVQAEERLQLAILFLCVPLASIFLITWLISNTPFVNIPARIMFAVPFFYLLGAKGIGWFPRREARMAALLGLTLVNGYSLRNYYVGQQFVNPLYVVPTREIVDIVVRNSEPEDILVSDQDTGFLFYYERVGRPGGNPHLFSQPAQPVKQLLRQRPQARIWLLTFGRDATWRLEPRELLRWLEVNYRLTQIHGYGEQDATYRRLKKALTGREPYEYKALLRLFVPKGDLVR